MPVGAAIGIGSIGAAAIGSSAAKSAAKTQATAATAGANQQAALGQDALDYQKGIDQRTYGDEAPYRAAGAAALPGYLNILGLGSQGAAGEQAALEATPGYQFTRDQGIASEARALGSKGLTGPQSKGIARFVTGLADNTYGQQVGLLNQAVGVGQTGVSTGAGIGATTGGQVGSTAGAIGSAITSGLTGAANATAGGTVGSANALSGAVGGLSNAYLYSKLLGGGTPSGLYSANGLGSGVTNI